MNTITDMLCDYRISPKGLGNNKLMFLWKIKNTTDFIKQVKYRIVVCSTIDRAKCLLGDIFDSGIVNSEECFF